MSALDTQVGGDHYTRMKIQPMEFSVKNGLNPLQHTIIKYISRHRFKNGRQDVEKVIHTIDLALEIMPSFKSSTYKRRATKQYAEANNMQADDSAVVLLVASDGAYTPEDLYRAREVALDILDTEYSL